MTRISVTHHHRRTGPEAHHNAESERYMYMIIVGPLNHEM